jgi:hypothetical protein
MFILGIETKSHPRTLYPDMAFSQKYQTIKTIISEFTSSPLYADETINPNENLLKNYPDYSVPHPKSHVSFNFCGYLTTLLNVKCPVNLLGIRPYSCYKYDCIMQVNINITSFCTSSYFQLLIEFVFVSQVSVLAIFTLSHLNSVSLYVQIGQWTVFLVGMCSLASVLCRLLKAS